MTLTARFAQLRLAQMMLTRLPMGQIGGVVPTLAEARWAFPMAGLPVGLIGWTVFAGGVSWVWRI